MRKLIFILLSSFILPIANAQKPFLKKMNGKYVYGLKDNSDREIAAPKYDEIKDFHKGVAKIKLNEKWGLIDSTGKELAYPKYDDLEFMENGLPGADVSIDGKWGILDFTGKEYVAPKYTAQIEINIFERGAIVKVRDPNDLRGVLIGFLDEGLQEVISPKYHFLEKEWFGNYIVGLGRDKLKYGLLDADYKQIFPMIYDELFVMSDDIYMLEKNGKSVLANKNGGVICSIEYETLSKFFNGRAKIQRKGKYGFIDEKGYEIISCKFDAADNFLEDDDDKIKAKVVLNGRKYYIDKAGAETK